MSLLFRQLVARAGRPPADPYKDLELYSFWVGNILPTSTRDRQEMIQARSTKQRMVILIRLLMETIEQTRLSAEDAGLALQCGGGGFSRADTAATGASAAGAGAGAASAASASAASASAASAAETTDTGAFENTGSAASDTGTGRVDEISADATQADSREGNTSLHVSNGTAATHT